jgi:hypothetical protein
MTIPAVQAFEAGTDPFQARPPKECDPQRDTTFEKHDYFELDEFNQRLDGIPDDLLIPNAANVAVEFANGAGQRFDVVVAGADNDVVQAYIGETGICLEAFPIDRVPVPIDTVNLDAILVRATGLNATDLSAKRDARLAAGSPGSLAEVLVNEGVAPGAVLATAISDATTQLNDAMSQGHVPSDAMAGTSVDALLDALLQQPGAPFIVDPALQAQDGNRWAGILDLERERKIEQPVLVTFASVQRPADPNAAADIVWFAVDPPINEGQYRAYRAICSTYAGVQLYATKGSATVSFWRQTPYLDIGKRYDAAGGSASSWLSASGDRTSWDAGVYGWRDGSYYSLYGGWTEGTGGFC